MTIKSISMDQVINIFIAGLSILFLALTNDFDDDAIVFHSSAKQAEKETSPLSPPEPSACATVSVVAPRLAMRSGPGINNTVIGLLHQGDVLTVLSCAPDWLYVKIADGGFGWVKEKSTRQMIPPEVDRLFPENSMPVLKICIN